MLNCLFLQLLNYNLFQVFVSVAILHCRLIQAYTQFVPLAKLSRM